MTQAPIEDVLAAMEKFGGSFVRQLAGLYRLADEDNRCRIHDAFGHYFTRYDELLTVAKRHQP